MIHTKKKILPLIIVAFIMIICLGGITDSKLLAQNRAFEPIFGDASQDQNVTGRQLNTTAIIFSGLPGEFKFGQTSESGLPSKILIVNPNNTEQKTQTTGTVFPVPPDNKTVIISPLPPNIRAGANVIVAIDSAPIGQEPTNISKIAGGTNTTDF
jgi:hypothetical protein